MNSNQMFLHFFVRRKSQTATSNLLIHLLFYVLCRERLFHRTFAEPLRIDQGWHFRPPEASRLLWWVVQFLVAGLDRPHQSAGGRSSVPGQTCPPAPPHASLRFWNQQRTSPLIIYSRSRCFTYILSFHVYFSKAQLGSDQECLSRIMQESKQGVTILWISSGVI